MKNAFYAIVWLLVWGCEPLAVAAERPPGWAIASAHPLATDAGLEIALAGGNAFDAAVAVSSTLAVVEPMGSGLGGGGFWLLHRAHDGRQVMVDGRERAPRRAHRDMYLDANGDIRPGASLNGALAAAIPGEPAALVHIAARYGRLALTQSLAPAARLARNGFPVTPRYRRLVDLRRSVFNDTAAQVLLMDGEVPELGALIRQPGLADTLDRIAERGHAGFYAGVTAKRLVDAVQAGGGLWGLDDLATYVALEREPIRSRYRGVELISAAPPSSGGIVLAEMLNMLAQWELHRLTQVEHTHRVIEVMRRAYRDRAMFLGDPDFVDVDVHELLSTSYARRLSADIGGRATPSESLPAAAGQGRDTTHFSILDAKGNRVAATLSINYAFGAGFMAGATGVLLNNEMDDFVAKPGVANVYGLVGGAANAIAPGKRPLSSMSPTFLETKDAVAIIGTPGGSRIISMVLLATMAFAEGVRDPVALVGRPRFHHQYLPDQVVFEPNGLPEAVQVGLRLKGHILKPRESTFGNMQAVVWQKDLNRLRAASDPRGEGKALVKVEQP